MEFNVIQSGLPMGEGQQLVRTASSSPIEKVSVGEVREIRAAFEQENKALQHSLGQSEHQSLMIAMYEATENMVGKELNQFEIMTYLEDLKSTAQDLHGRGLSREEFRDNLMRHTHNSVFHLLKST